MGRRDKEEPQQVSGEGQGEDVEQMAHSLGNVSEEEELSKVDAAKAFFRSLYTGNEPITEGTASDPALVEEERMNSNIIPENGICPTCEHQESQMKGFEQKAVESEQLYKRMAADFENYRRRAEKEREDLVNVGVRKTVETLLPALDDLDRALSFLTIDTDPEKLIQSFQLVSNRIFSCLEQLGVKQLDTKGKVFDPRYHEPVQQVETKEYPDGTVMQELRRGYALDDKVVRPALVNVALNRSGEIAPVPQATKPQAEKDETEEDQDIKVYDLGDDLESV